jgi:hypothetical protein
MTYRTRCRHLIGRPGNKGKAGFSGFTGQMLLIRKQVSERVFCRAVAGGGRQR